MKRYSDEEVEFLKRVIPERTSAEIIKLFKDEFGEELRKPQIDYFKKKHGIKSEEVRNKTSFKKGNIPWNKGKKGYCPKGSEVGWFRKGHKPWLTRKIYEEKKDKDGYTLIKLDDRRKWKRKHIWIWEKEYGKIPDGYCLLFKDNDKSNIRLDNLILVSRGVNAVLNKRGDEKKVGIEKEIVVKLAKLKIKENQLRRSRGGKRK